MGKKSILTTIAGYALMFAGVFLFRNVAIAKAGYYLAVTGMLSGAADLLAPKPKPIRSTQTVEYFGTVDPRRIVYGTQKISGLQVIPPWVSGDNRQYLHQVIALAGHEGEITSVYFDKTEITTDQITAVTGALDDGKVTGGTYEAKAWIRRYNGTSTQTVDYILTSAFSAYWTSAHRGREVAYLALQYEYDEEVYKQGKPEVSAMFKGARCYDPRLDSTPGQNPDSASCIGYTANPALCLTHYLLHARLGLGESASRIDWTLVVAAADICDESVAIPGSTTQPRYTCNVVMNVAATDDERRDNMEMLASAMMGHVVYRGGQWRMYAGGPATSSFTIGESDVIGRVELRTELPSSEKYNYVRGQYLDAARDYQVSEFKPRADAAYESADGDRKPREITFDACNNEYEAQRNATIVLKRSRLKRSVSLGLGMSCYRLRPWDVVTVNLPQVGLDSRLMRCIAWSFSQEGYIEAQFLEEANSTWDDPAVEDYTEPGESTTPDPNESFIPYPPTAFSVTGITDAIVFSWTRDTRNYPAIRHNIYQSDDADGMTADPVTATIRAQVTGEGVTLPAGTTGTKYYWIKAVDVPSGSESTAVPDGNGVAAAALTVTSGFRVTLSHSSILRTLEASSTGTTNTVSSTVTGGTPAFTYAWARISGSSGITATSPTASSTTFSVTGLSNLTTQSATFTLTVTDSDSPAQEVTASVYVSFTRNDYL